MSNKGLARRVVDLAAPRGLASVRCDHTSVLRWLAGEQPRPPVPELVAEVLSNALGRKVSETELGMTPSDLPGDLGHGHQHVVAGRQVVGAFPGDDDQRERRARAGDAQRSSARVLALRRKRTVAKTQTARKTMVGPIQAQGPPPAVTTRW